MNRLRLLLLIPLLLGLTLSCDIADNNIDTTNTFVKIYDDSRFEEEYFPVDVIQTADNGYLILSEKKNDQSLFTSVFVLKVDEKGEVVSSIDLPEPSSLPVKGWSKIDDRYYFVCMNANTLSAQLIAVDDDGTVADPVVINGLTYPLATKVDGQNIAVLSYDNQDTESVISVVATNGQITQQASYSIGAGVDVEKPIIDHLTRNGRQLPFQVGNTGGSYYFNGFYNYTFSLVFTNFGGSPIGVCQGQLSAGGISAISSLGGSNFGISRFNFDANFLNPLATIPTNSTTSSTDLGGNTFPEIEVDTEVDILQIEDNSSLIFGSNTQAKKLVLYGFDDSGKALGTRYIGTDNPYTFAAFTTTSDGGLAILARTALEGRFPRIALFKRDAGFLNSLLSE